ncbi:glycosyltransferase [Pseudodesulfovibrio sp. zrk46]|uniref:glycosyltransferase family protein n=1 Tax=Pseudodesulfovibrio sp. zrk46 TaxID=2725288 RepID=UPI001449870A|nr:glycosyltransferase [Pseudodesulfovibrio sp. zrk46]QJB55989.1 hypothetical protein HFN16_05995 [Pseudodesulfovibrio sp. zrk46]
MRVLFYCQHVLGVGHVFRSLEIVKGLADHEVILVTGGAELDIEPPANMTHIQLPGLMMSPDFKTFIPLEEGVTDVDALLERRLAQFRDIMAEHRPDIFLVELFPFGRKKFRFELLPILEDIRKGTWGNCKSVCSVRDILVEKDDMEKYTRGVLKMLNPNFDAVLVHADPELVTFDETFPGVKDMVPKLHYTGYVACKPAPGAGQALRNELGVDDTPLIVTSVGGGNVCQELIDSVLEASPILNETHPHRLCIFTGPYATDDNFARYQQMAEPYPWISVRRFTQRFPDYLAAADLSVSLGGYNTTMNLLAADTYGLMYPFMQNREQSMRAKRLEEKGILKLLGSDDLAPATMAKMMGEAIDHPAQSHTIDLDGAANTARLLETIVSS